MLLYSRNCSFSFKIFFYSDGFLDFIFQFQSLSVSYISRVLTCCRCSCCSLCCSSGGVLKVFSNSSRISSLCPTVDVGFDWETRRFALVRLFACDVSVGDGNVSKVCWWCWGNCSSGEVISWVEVVICVVVAGLATCPVETADRKLELCTTGALNAASE